MAQVFTNHMGRKPYTGMVRYFDNRDDYTLKDEFYRVNGQIEGIYTRYNNQGEKRMLTTYIADKKNGAEKNFHTNGNLYMICFYENNLKNGECRKYFDSGELQIKFNYINDRIEGEYKEYHKNGS